MLEIFSSAGAPFRLPARGSAGRGVFIKRSVQGCVIILGSYHSLYLFVLYVPKERTKNGHHRSGLSFYYHPVVPEKQGHPVTVLDLLHVLADYLTAVEKRGDHVYCHHI